MFKPAITDPEQIKAILQKTLTAKADSNSSTNTTTAASSSSNKEQEWDSSKEDRPRYCRIGPVLIDGARVAEPPLLG